MNGWLIAGAAGAMVIQDVIGTMGIQAAARSRAAAAGLLDCVYWLAVITTTTVSVDALLGHNLAQKAWTIGAVTVANFTGTYAGVRLGDRFIRRT